MKMQGLHRFGKGSLGHFFLIGAVLALTAFSGEADAASSSGSVGDSPDNAVRTQADVYFKKGEQYQRREQFKLAEAQYRQAVSIDASYAEAFSNLGFTLRKQGAYDEAVRYYKKAIELDYKLAEAHEYLGEAYAEMGQFSLAEQELRILRDLNSDEADELSGFIMQKRRG